MTLSGRQWEQSSIVGMSVSALVSMNVAFDGRG